jgi:hypothetical protein
MYLFITVTFLYFFLLTNAVVKPVGSDICCCNNYVLGVCTGRMLKEESVVYHHMIPGNALNNESSQ